MQASVTPIKPYGVEKEEVERASGVVVSLNQAKFEVKLLVSRLILGFISLVAVSGNVMELNQW